MAVSDPGTDADLFDADFLASLRRLFVRLRQRRTSLRQGEKQAPAIGRSREFKDRRAYVSGDDYRTIDWRLYARLDRLYVRLFEDVREHHLHLLVDCSASMVEPYPAKRRLALRATAAMAFLALENQHRVSLHALGETPRRLLPPLKGKGQLSRVLDALAGLRMGGPGRVCSALAGFRPGGRAVIQVFSDLLDEDPDQVPEALARLASRPADTTVVHLLARRELEPELEGALRLVDVEHGEQREVMLGRGEREAYRALIADWCQRLERTASERRLGYLRWLDDEPFEDRLLDLLEHGRALAGAR